MTLLTDLPKLREMDMCAMERDLLHRLQKAASLMEQEMEG